MMPAGQLCTSQDLRVRRKEDTAIYESIGTMVNISFYVLAAVVIISAVIKIVKSKKDKENGDEKKG